MSVTLFEGVIDAYMETSPGLIDDIEQRAQRVVEEARANVEHIMWRMPFVSQSVQYRMEGNEAIIGIVLPGRIEEYLDDKAFREGGSWLGDALVAARDA